MKRRMKIFCGVSLTGILACSFWLPSDHLFAENDESETTMEGMSYADQTGLFLSLDENGNVSYVEPDIEDQKDELTLPEESDEDTTFEVKMKFGDESQTIGEYDTFEEANAAMTRRSLFRSVGSLEVYSNDQLRTTSSYSVVNFNTSYNTTNYTEVGTGTSGYTYGGYAADAAFLGTSTDGKKVKFKLAGVTGWVNKSDVEIVPYSASLTLSYYSVSDGYLYHYISTNLDKGSTSSTQIVGKAPSYLSSGTKYYSYDGHYFYTSYPNMIEDYKGGHSNRAVNKNNPFYNYYQFLSHRTKTTFTAADFDNRVNAEAKGSSKMKNAGQYFICSQNEFSANASLIFGVAVNESAWGQSKIANDKNNLFGHGAVDSDPYKGAFTYESVSESIQYHAQTFVDIGYLDPADSRYFGPHLGDKASGMNVKYASDPYWGEKAAAQSHYLEMQTGKDDSCKYTLGIYKGNEALNIYKEPNTSSTILYNTGTGNGNPKRIDEFPFVILGEEKGTSVNGNTTWYKIQTDGALIDNRNSLYPYKPNTFEFVDEYKYKFNKSYAYVPAALLNKIQIGTNSVTTNGGSTCDTTNPTPEPTPAYKKGDVNGDGKITPADYVMIRNHINGKKKLTGNSLTSADVNGDDKVLPSDYVMVRNHINGKKIIKW